MTVAATVSIVNGTGDTRRVFMHVGSPKTGTTFLQNVLWSQRDLAKEQGLLLPLDRFADHFYASLDIRGLSTRPEHPPRAHGIWQRLVAEANAWPGNVLVSHELFAAATAAQAADALASFGPGSEVHVVLTARDLFRQIPAEWQEHLKHRSTKTLDEFVSDLMADRAGKSWFWKVQDFAKVLDRWGRTLPPDRIHVVTVPPAGGDPGVLWTRFAQLLELDPAAFDTTGSRANTSLGAEQAELLRRVNLTLGDRVPLPGPYPVVVKNVLAHQILAARKGSPLALDERTTRFAVRRSRGIADALAERGYDVRGDLAELVPTTTATAAAAGPGVVPGDTELLDEALESVAGLLTVMARRGPQARYEDLIRQLRRRPLRFALIQASNRHPSLMRARRAYRRVTRRTRPSPPPAR